MSDNNPITADPESLAFDVAPMAAAAKKLASTKDPVVKYVAQVRTIPMGEQPIKVDGVVVSHYDVLAKKPELKAKLYTAIHHAEDVEGYLLALHNWSKGAATQMAGYIVGPLEAIQTILNASTKISDADLRRIREQMQYVAMYTQLVKTAMNSNAFGIQRFISGLATDHDTFASGPYELHSVYTELGAQISADAMPFVLDLKSRGIGEAMLQVGRAFLGSIEHLGQKMVDALAVHEAMGTSVSALATACKNALEKYEPAANEVALANSETIRPTMRKLHIGNAITSWNDFAKFFSETDL